MEIKKDEIVTITKSWLIELAEEQFEVHLTEEQLEAIECAIIEGGISDFLYDTVEKIITHKPEEKYEDVFPL